MRPPTNDSAIAVLRSKLPEFEDNYLDLVDIYDDDLTPEIVLMELADFVANLVARGGDEETLEQTFAAVEDLAANEAEGPELVAYCFLNELPLGSRDAIMTYLGRVTTYLADLVYRGESIEDGEATAAGEATDDVRPLNS
jgi:hypothetical protein